MTTLVALWNVSLLLCAIALLALVVMMIARFIVENRLLMRGGERRRAAAFLLEGGDWSKVKARTRLEQDAAAKVTLELAELVRGPDRAAMLERAEEIGIDRVLLRHSLSGAAQDRLLAAEALAMFPARRDRVRQMLADRNPDVRLGAALALAQNQAAPPAGELVRRLGLGSEERSLLIASLMRDLVDTDPASVESLLADPAVPDATRLAAIDALAASGRVEHAPLLAQMAEASTPDSDLLPRIHHALGRIGHPSGHKAIRHGLTNPAWEVRAAAAQAAGQNGLADTAATLGGLLGDPSWWVRFRSGEALWRLGADGRAVLTAIARSGDPVAREAAATTLAERGA